MHIESFARCIDVHGHHDDNCINTRTMNKDKFPILFLSSIVTGILAICIIFLVIPDITKRNAPYEIAEKYWHATQDKDYGVRYDLSCSELKDNVSRDKYIQKSPTGKKQQIIHFDLKRSESYKDMVIIDTEIDTNLAFGQRTTTILRFENNQWCKVVSQDDINWLKS